MMPSFMSIKDVLRAYNAQQATSGATVNDRQFAAREIEKEADKSMKQSLQS
jgi:hypothetical protein